MSILSFNVNVTGLVGETVNPRRNTMVSTDTLATITAAGYLNNQNSSGNPILPTDIFEVIYGYNTSTKAGTFGIFQVSYSSSTGFSLVEWTNPGNVLLPVTSGDFAIFNGTDGQIKDAGYAPSNAADPYVVMSPGSVTVGHLAKFNDANGTLADQGVQMKTVAQAAVAGGAAAQTVTDAFCTTASCVIATWNDTTNAVSIQKVAAGNGSFVVTSSADPGASHLNYVIFKV